MTLVVIGCPPSWYSRPLLFRTLQSQKSGGSQCLLICRDQVRHQTQDDYQARRIAYSSSRRLWRKWRSGRWGGLEGSAVVRQSSRRSAEAPQQIGAGGVQQAGAGRGAEGLKGVLGCGEHPEAHIEIAGQVSRRRSAWLGSSLLGDRARDLVGGSCQADRDRRFGSDIVRDGAALL